MKQLLNNCRAGKMSITPKNWKTQAANKKLLWKISYWFYDDNLKQKRKVVIKGMNRSESLKEKQEITQLYLQDEIDQLENGYNPITKQWSKKNDSDLSEYTSIIEALDYAYNSLYVLRETKIDIKSCVKFIKIAIRQLHYENIPVGQVRKKHIKSILDQCGKIGFYKNDKGKMIEKKWSENQHNHYRKYLAILFNELDDITDGNPVLATKKRQQIKRIRETVTTDQRIEIKEFTKNTLYNFWRFIQIFFHSGSRISELLQVKKKDVNIKEQKFKIVQRKGKSYTEVFKTIKNIALPVWEEIMNEASGNQYLFSKNLAPGDVTIRRDQVTKRWNKYIKKGLGITADLYSLKHSNLDAIAEASGLPVAQDAAGHSTSAITLVYAHGEKERKHNRLKQLDNEF